MNAEDRFWKKVDCAAGPDGCWLWTGGTNGKSYGRFWHEGKKVYAHRFSWELRNGSAPAGSFVCHNCPGGDNPRCVNPAHLWLGTNGENVLDAYSKGLRRAARGEQVVGALLTECEVRAIRLAVAEGATQMSQARIYGVRHATVNNVVHGRTWRHVLATGGGAR